MEVWTVAALVAGIAVFSVAINFVYARSHDKAWFEGVRKLGLVPAGKYPWLTAAGKWGGGTIEVRHFRVTGGRWIVTWHEIVYSKPGLSKDSLTKEQRKLGFEPMPDSEHTVHRRQRGELGADHLGWLLKAFGPRE